MSTGRLKRLTAYDGYYHFIKSILFPYTIAIYQYMRAFLAVFGSPLVLREGVAEQLKYPLIFILSRILLGNPAFQILFSSH